MLRDIDVKRLRLFKRVVECGGLSAAEAALDINLSTISAHLTALEASLGLRLCERGRKGFRLTVQGQSVLEASDRLLDAYAQFDTDLAGIHRTISGSLRLGIVDATISDPNSRLSRAIAALKRQSADLEISIDIRSPAELERAIVEQQLDLAIGPRGPSAVHLRKQDLYSETVSLYVGGTHPLFARKDPAIDLSQLQGQDFVARGYLRESQVHGKTVAFKSSATAHSVEGLAIFVLSGAYLGYLPDHYADRWVALGQMRAIRSDLFSHRVAFQATSLRERQNSPAMQVLLRHLAEPAPEALAA
ncbi:LysR family transcriptional regulator [soil metagenome]